MPGFLSRFLSRFWPDFCPDFWADFGRIFDQGLWPGILGQKIQCTVLLGQRNKQKVEDRPIPQRASEFPAFGPVGRDCDSGRWSPIHILVKELGQRNTVLQYYRDRITQFYSTTGMEKNRRKNHVLKSDILKNPKYWKPSWMSFLHWFIGVVVRHRDSHDWSEMQNEQHISAGFSMR